MQSRIAALVMMVALAFVPAAFAGGKKEGKASISFHLETAGTDNPKMIIPQQMQDGKTRYFLRSPEITINDVTSFASFPADGGTDYGLVLALKANAASRLSAITNTNQGRYLLAQVNGRIVDAVMIDKEVNDGKIVIWKGATLADVTLLDSELPRIGQKEKKK